VPIVEDHARGRLERVSFEFRGDKGDQGGVIYVLEDAPARRVAHAQSSARVAGCGLPT
jgi:hypothetical protein